MMEWNGMGVLGTGTGTGNRDHCGLFDLGLRIQGLGIWARGVNREVRGFFLRYGHA